VDLSLPNAINTLKESTQGLEEFVVLDFVSVQWWKLVLHRAA
jgi:hypothetical protein